jgi:hypothetical protein
MRSGILRDVATFQKRPATKDGYGQTSGAYANVAALVNVPVAIEDLFGSELYQGAGASSERDDTVHDARVSGLARRHRPDLEDSR